MKKNISKMKTFIIWFTGIFVAILCITTLASIIQNSSYDKRAKKITKLIQAKLDQLPANQKNTIGVETFLTDVLKAKRVCTPSGNCFGANYKDLLNKDLKESDLNFFSGACAVLKTEESICLEFPTPTKRVLNSNWTVHGWLDLNTYEKPNILGRDLRRLKFIITMDGDVIASESQDSEEIIGKESSESCNLSDIEWPNDKCCKSPEFASKEICIECSDINWDIRKCCDKVWKPECCKNPDYAEGKDPRCPIIASEERPEICELYTFDEDNSEYTTNYECCMERYQAGYKFTKEQHANCCSIAQKDRFGNTVKIFEESTGGEEGFCRYGANSEISCYWSFSTDRRKGGSLGVACFKKAGKLSNSYTIEPEKIIFESNTNARYRGSTPDNNYCYGIAFSKFHRFSTTNKDAKITDGDRDVWFDWDLDASELGYETTSASKCSQPAGKEKPTATIKVKLDYFDVEKCKFGIYGIDEKQVSKNQQRRTSRGCEGTYIYNYNGRD